MSTAGKVATETKELKKPSRKPLDVRIDDIWYDLSGWRFAHPSGAHWIDGFADKDATEVMYAFHSDEANQMLQRLPHSKSPPVDAPPATPLMLGFRDLRARLVAEGWFKRVWWREAFNLAPVLSLYTAGTLLARRLPLLAIVLLGLGSSGAGWVAHDYIHGRGRFCSAMRGFGALFNGHSATWWSNKHNLHHACTNEVGVDEDIMSDPFFFLWAPDPARDSKWRKLQHLYTLPVYSILFALWRFNSLRVIASAKKTPASEAFVIGLNYLWMCLCLPLPVAVGHVLLSGVISATIVTVSHQSEDLFHETPNDWVLQQMQSTRDAVTSNGFSEWLWGGMQYQLEHHLFPTMPRYYYPKLVPVIREFCEEHGVEYRADGEFEIVRRNFQMLSEVSAQPAVVGAPPTRRTTVWSEREGAAWVGSSS